ncbi:MULTISPECIES: hypothetical protein [unclassified Desulfovibrio]|uniref:hypothetical protein n=1 Tax=unclassified Desulfovibrio TaxID=2593640 RepID=UPI000F5FF063|nr:MULTISPECIES: hypothetical protein [unclassified Desulfovibrio]RRD71546.1 hypothetical protein EII24_02700 [Desulfovibrio sp. OH1209_COT-279]RRD87791.1 hypothetical protein EII23_02700 [Desulfovibrio sp. OH1186_COT-070]
MAEKKAILVDAAGMNLAASGEATDKLNKKAAVLVKGDPTGIVDKAVALGAVKVDAAALAQTLENTAFAVTSGGEDAVAAALDAANRRTVVVVAAKDGIAFYGMGINGKAGKVVRPATAGDIVLTIATLVDLPITENCTAAIVYQVLKDPNMKLNEIIKLREALARMESVIERNNREPWDKHDCA